jgi:putative membrane-bound dehydrogenase-like protein
MPARRLPVHDGPLGSFAYTLGVLTRKVLSAGAVALAVLAGGRALIGQKAPAGGAAGPPYTPAQSMALLEIEPGLRVELVASEPDVQSPVAMDIDEDGRMFVVEMPGYPLDVSPTGRVVLLEDANADGRIDKRTVFADNLRLPSGIMRHKRGVLVTSPPDLLYFEDVNGDGRADVREVVLTGFAKTNPQHAVNHPVYGLDNWIYLAHSGGSQPVIYADLFGDQGKDLTFPGRPEVKGLDSRGRGVRLKPDAFLVEGLSSRTQYGNAFDVYGRFFAHNNSVHQRHEVLAARYAERNPHLLLPTAMAEISDHGNNNILPITHGARFDLLTEPGQFTSACGLTVYTGGAFPAGYEGTTVIAEPVHNLVHRDVLAPRGATFTASRARADKEFLASRDAWFRPVNFFIGPDGALYVIDYYRPYIEHPEWASSDLQKSPEILSTGKDRGRIYRIVSAAPPGAKAPRPRLGSASDAELVQALAHTNSWWRRTAQRLLVSKGRRDAVPALERLAETRPTALGRLHALWTLEGLDRLAPALVRQALNDADAGIRENAIILAERSLKDPATIDALLALADDPDPRVRFQLLATLGFVDTPASRAAQDRLLLRDIEDEWLQLAALSASSDRAMAWFTRALDPAAGLVTTESPGRARFLDRLGGIVAARQKDAEIARIVAVVTDPAAPAGDWWRASLLEGLARGTNGVAGKKAIEATQDTLLTLATGEQPRLRRAAVTLLTVSGISPGAAATAAVQRAARVATDATAAVDTRVDAITLLALADAPAHRPTFEQMIVSTEPEAVQLAGVTALGRIPGAETPAFLLRRWPTLASPVRTAAATVVLGRREGSLAMLEALENGTVKVWMLNFGHKRSLIMHRDAAIRAEARTVLEESPAARAQRISRYAAALGGRGDARRGADVFARHCAMCHQVDGAAGVEIGPDLSTVRHQPMPVLLANILEPNRSIAQHYETYQVERASGEPLVGIIGEQSPTSITFRQGPGQTTIVKRGDIKQMTVVPQSIMPESFDQQITPADMAHLLAYLTAAPRSAAR